MEWLERVSDVQCRDPSRWTFRQHWPRPDCAVVTHKNAGPLGMGECYAQRMLAAPDVDHYHHPVAIVVADTFEQACAAAAQGGNVQIGAGSITTTGVGSAGIAAAAGNGVDAMATSMAAMSRLTAIR